MKKFPRIGVIVLLWSMVLLGIQIAGAQTNRDADRSQREYDRYESLRMQRELLEVEQKRLAIEQERREQDQQRSLKQIQKGVIETVNAIDRKQDLLEKSTRDNDLKMKALVATNMAAADKYFQKAQKLLEDVRDDAKKLKRKVVTIPSFLNTPYETSSNFLRSSLEQQLKRCKKTSDDLGEQAKSGSERAQFWSLQKASLMLSHCTMLGGLDGLIDAYQVDRYVRMLRAKEASPSDAKALEVELIKADRQIREEFEAVVKSNDETYWGFVNM